MWDERYSTEEFAYGKEPNDFLKERVELLPVGRTLCLAEGEGRNAVFLATCGHRVTAVDQSRIGLEKAERLAQERDTRIRTLHSDLTRFEILPQSWDAIVSIFAHLPPPLRRAIHRDAVSGLRPGGVFLLEAYTPEQLRYRTGGPPVEELMMTLETLQAELEGLEWLHAQELVRDIQEGEFHQGRGAVVQLIGRKPPEQAASGR
ncbi:MAG: class I SAM-dependent methyltransferase [Gammaproteobacteria bacterium]|jgi:SAM-dependent methyltransferase